MSYIQLTFRRPAPLHVRQLHRTRTHHGHGLQQTEEEKDYLDDFVEKDTVYLHWHLQLLFLKVFCFIFCRIPFPPYLPTIVASRYKWKRKPYILPTQRITDIKLLSWNKHHVEDDMIVMNRLGIRTGTEKKQICPYIRATLKYVG